MTETIHKGEVFSFWKLLSENRIEVPIIQRDYAQGRIDEREIRDNFLNALYQSLDDSVAIKLDFIYGSIENKILQPLDGQQRLTTLFLLHWYAAVRENQMTEEVRNKFLQFTYETRISSREFCIALVNKHISINDCEEDLREKIVDSPWFVLSWEKDPTIDAMLRTINDINNKFCKVENLWAKLSADDCFISFYHVELKNIGLTDDLYIKMNARGKLLSPFENFKASFQKYIIDNNWERNVEFQDTFACQVDNKWTDLLWSHRKEDSVDEAFMRLASTVAMIRLSLERHDNRVSNIALLQENPNALKPEMISGQGFTYLNDCFNLYSKLYSSKTNLTLNFNLWQHSADESIFSAVVFEDNTSSNIQKNSASYTQKVLFFAQTEYLRKVSTFDLEKYQDWMRIIRNIISRGDITKYGDRPTIIRSPQTFDGVINLVYELSEGCEDINLYLAKLQSVKSSFAKEQVEEEILKAKLINQEPSYKSTIIELEDNNLLRGRIAFALFCIDFHKEEVSFGLDIDLLKLVSNVFTKYFNQEDELSNSLRRALLTIENDGVYEYYTYWWSFWNVASADKRCLIDKYRELEYYLYSEHKIYFKKLILRLIDKTYDEIINDFIPPQDMPGWKVRLIKDETLLNNFCRSNYIAIPKDNSCCYLLKSMRPRDLNGCEKIDSISIDSTEVVI